jgi:hypothetical protein
MISIGDLLFCFLSAQSQTKVGTPTFVRFLDVTHQALAAIFAVKHKVLCSLSLRLF